MLSSRVHKSALIVCVVALFALALPAQEKSAALSPAAHTLTITLKGTLGPVLSGSDPLGLNGQSGSVAIMASESLSPTKHNATSATYKLPAGAITIVAGSTHFTTTTPSKMTVNLLTTADTLTLAATGPDGLQITATTFLKAGSWTTAVLKHPTVFEPSPQKLTAAKTVGGAGCKLKYTLFGSSTVLGFKGTASNKATLDMVSAEEDLER
jgi:hypothetical protein